MGLVQSAAQVEVHRPRIPQPLRAGLPWLLVAVVLLAGALFGVDARYLVAAAAGCLVVGAVRALLESRDLWALRRAADAVLRTGARPALTACLAALGGPAASIATGPSNTAPDVFDPGAAADGRISAHGGGNL